MEVDILDIREQILQECREIFESELSLIRKYDENTREVMPDGIPEALMIAEFEQNTRSLNKIRRGKNSREFKNAWIYKDGVLRETVIKKEPDKDGPADGFYRETYARFAFSEEKRVAYLNFYYAPRYWKGWIFPIIESDKGLKLGESSLQWLY